MSRLQEAPLSTAEALPVEGAPATDPADAPPAAPPLPHEPVSEADDLPITIIERRRGWQVLNLRELWRYRELLYFLTWRDIKVRYKQTLLGALWAILQPLATMLVFVLFLGRVAGISSA